MNKGNWHESTESKHFAGNYNGEKFLKTQLDSLIEQTYENIDIYVRDDCSTDNTVEFIKNYIESNKSGKRIILLENNGVNLRPPKSFYQIARECEPAEYYAFCDQDDVWYPDKIKWGLKNLRRKKIQINLWFIFQHMIIT